MTDHSPVACLLCHSRQVAQLDTVQLDQLRRLYEKRLKLEIQNETVGFDRIVFYRCEDCDLRFFYPPITGSEAFYESLQASPWYYRESKPEYDYALQVLRDSHHVLEIGSGKGAFAKLLDKPGYLGLELSQAAARWAEAEGAQVVNQSLEEHAQEHPGEYDGLCAFQVLEHVADPASLLYSGQICLKPGGQLVLSVPSADSYVSMVTNGPLNMPPHHVTWWTDRCLQNVADLFGLELVDLWHEPLEEVHRQWYATQLVLESFRQWLGLPYRLVDFSTRYWLLSKLAALFSRLLKYGLRNPALNPYGHSVVAVYRKGDEAT